MTMPEFNEKDLRIIRIMTSFFDGSDGDLFDHLQCTPEEWDEFLMKLDMEVSGSEPLPPIVMTIEE